MGGRTAPGMVLAAVAALVLAAPADAAGTTFKAKVPAEGAIAITQAKLKVAGRHPRRPHLRLAAKRRLPADVTVVGTVRRVHHRHGVYVVRILIGRKAGKRARAHAAQDFNFTPVNVNLPGVHNIGVTGTDSLGFLPTSPNLDGPPKGLCPDSGVAREAAVSILAGVRADEQRLTALDRDLCKLGFGPAVRTGLDALQSEPPGPWREIGSKAIGFNAVDLAVGDFNGDGQSDIVVVGDAPLGGLGQLVLFVGRNDGSFGSPLSFALSSAPVSVAAADIDLDGLTDIAVGEANHTVDVFSGFFLTSGLQPHTILDPIAVLETRSLPVAVAFGAINGDPFADIVEGSQDGLVAFLGDGAMHFTPEPLSSDPIVSLTLARINDNLFNDIVAATPDPTNPNQFFLIGDLDGGASPLPPMGPFPGPPPRGLTPSLSNFPRSTGTVDADSDIFVATTTGVEVFENQQPSTTPLFTPLPTRIPAGTDPVGTVLVDVNNDHLPDVVTVNHGSGTVTTSLDKMELEFTGPLGTVVGRNPRAMALLDFGPDPDVAVVLGSGKHSRLLLLGIPAPTGTLPSPPTFTPPPTDSTIPPKLIDDLIGSLLNNEPDVTRQAIIDITEWLKAHGLARHTPRAGQASVAVTHTGRITQFAIRGYGAQPSGTPIRFRVLRPQPDGTWVPVLTSKFVTLPPENGLHVYKTSDLDPNGPDAFPVQPGDEIGVFQNADAPGHNPGDPTDWTIFSSQPGSQMYEIAHHNGFNNGDAETPTTVDGLELLLQATVEPISCARSKTPYASCAAHLVTRVDAADAAHVGQPLTITDTVRNEGPSDADGVILTHGFPTNVTLGPLPAGCAQTYKQPPVVRCALGTLKWDANQTKVSFTMTPKNRRPIANSARVFSRTPDPDPSAEAAGHAQRVFAAH